MIDRFVTNRQEIKYLVSSKEAEIFCNRISDILIPDPRSGRHEYLNYSIYFDSPQLTIYNEQINGLEKRSKPRIRTYRANVNTPPLAIFLEFKYHDQNLITKKRTPLNAAHAHKILNSEKILGITYNTGDTVLDEFARLTERINLEAKVGILYNRKAFSCLIESGLRITLDTNIQFTTQKVLNPPEKALILSEPLNCAIIELKYEAAVPKQVLKAAEQLNFENANYSKYSKAIEHALGNPHDPMP